MAASRQIRIEVNADFVMSIRWKDSGGFPTPVDSAVLTIKSAITDASPLLVASDANGRAVIDGDNWVTFNVPANVLSALDVTNVKHGVYDILLRRTSDSRIKRIMAGSVIFVQGVG